ncbi:hypothetical protein LJC68_03005 [Bacteroidales bacterium OttesenSCG-928-B11]|nr:hypothetical protein [Bacteroidales bacterium OttesenSCG-928-C03]MDL2311830.1 hypothetical protein [Bacteroidales bacterium OttesenSCG-928-B11]MDL2325521.1 hypothetical protein [Bacteroidales bacterium OttesenSCG-928-A14]
MKNIRSHRIIFVLLISFIFSSCAPTITGRTKKKRSGSKNCGCEWIAPEKEKVNSLDQYAVNY